VRETAKITDKNNAFYRTECRRRNKVGFGLIFLGWMTFFSFKILPVGIFGCILMLCGLSKLTSYGKNFGIAKNICIGFLAYFTVFGVLWTLSMAGLFDFMQNSYMLFADEVVYYAFFVAFSCVLLRALGDISNLVGFDKGTVREKRGLSLMAVFGVFTLVRFILTPLNLGAYLRAPLVIFELICLIYIAVYLYSCYMMIATEEIIDKENKKMREYDAKYSFRTLKNRHK
jgi:hypothetical protein